MNKYTPEEPIAAIATALVPSAIGIVRTSGKNCIELVSKIFSRKKALLQAAGNSLVYGWIEDSRIQNGNKKIDEVMLGLYKAPKSFTGEDMVEIFSSSSGYSISTSMFPIVSKISFLIEEICSKRFPLKRPAARLLEAFVRLSIISFTASAFVRSTFPFI